jgi:hypothetical protein
VEVVLISGATVVLVVLIGLWAMKGESDPTRISGRALRNKCRAEHGENPDWDTPRRGGGGGGPGDGGGGGNGGG